MSDIFISYSSSDRPKVEPLVRLLEEQGWSVWWDKKIPIGKTYDDIISEALDASKCIVVVWTKNSIKSKWVRTEASEGTRRDVLVPVLLEKVRLPLEFRLIQAAQLLEWGGEITNPEATKFLDSVSAILGNPQSQPHSQRTVLSSNEVENTKDLKLQDSNDQRRLFSASFMLKAGVVFVSAILLALLIWKFLPQPTQPVTNNANSNAVTTKSNAVTTNYGTVTVIPVNRSDADVQLLVNALNQQGYKASAGQRTDKEHAPHSPEVRWYYSDDKIHAQEVLGIINRTLPITAKMGEDVENIPERVRGHVRGEIRAYLD